MKKLIVCFSALFISIVTFSQGAPPIDKSPMDMSYYPSGYPVLKIQDKITGPLVARVIYSRPQRSGRAIFGGLVKYGETWRFGANEATEIEFYKNVRLGNKKIKAGRYTLYAVVNETSWTIIVNKETDTWGSFKYDSKKDVARLQVPVQKLDSPIEYMSLYFEKTGTGMSLVMTWDNVKVVTPFNF